MADEDDFISRWSRRKREGEPEETPAAAPEPSPPETEPESEEAEAALLKELGLPRPESLGPGDDFQPFLRAGVPGFLRRRALRVLWRSNPVLANLDGLNDYDDDFNAPDLTKKILATAYQVGRGYVTQPKESEPKAEFDAAPEEPVAETVALQGETDERRVETSKPDYTEDDGEPQPRPRRMRFET